MAVPLLLLLLLAMFSGSDGAFCVCKPGLPDAMMQKAIDYACGKGADCTQTQPNGPCYSSQKTQVCNYIVNSYYQKNGPMGGTCDFGGVAFVTASDPSTGNCKFTAGSSSAGGAGTGGGMGAGTGAGTGAGAGTGTGTGTGMGGTGTGTGAGITTPGGALSPPFGGGAYGPSGSGTGPDYSEAAARPVLAAAFLAAAPLLLHFII
ncbi:hypothetical protein EJB05_36842 [Eragrostis curvula]|uniref:X8 domain-containing protein n=1 Tax=Eragrostis curvula TaxID=38414 RepID=A0A5J9UB91_9POAL|nr:hypothetical protein EJB05_36842 [Eragrostis curvula]